MNDDIEQLHIKALYDCWFSHCSKNRQKKAERVIYLLGEIKSYEDLVFVVAHTLSEEGWTWFYEPEMLEGNGDLVKLMCTIEGIQVVLSLFGISEMMAILITEYYASPNRRKNCEENLYKYLYVHHVPWPCIDVLSLIHKPCNLYQVEETILKVSRLFYGENL